MTRPLRGSRMAYSTGSPANARAVTANASPGAPSSANSPFLVPTSSSVISSSSRDRGQDVDAVVRTDRRLLPRGLAVDEHVDVAADPAALVEDPAAHRRALALQHAHELADGAGFQRMLRRAGHRLQLPSEPDERHSCSTDRRRRRNSSLDDADLDAGRPGGRGE